MLTQHEDLRWKVCIFVIVDKSNEKTDTNNELILLPSIDRAAKSRYTVAYPSETAPLLFKSY